MREVVGPDIEWLVTRTECAEGLLCFLLWIRSHFKKSGIYLINYIHNSFWFKAESAGFFEHQQALLRLLYGRHFARLPDSPEAECKTALPGVKVLSFPGPF